jgi:hypothetical protein
MDRMNRIGIEDLKSSIPILFITSIHVNCFPGKTQYCQLTLTKPVPLAGTV